MKVSIEDLKALPQRRLTLEFKEDLAGLGAIKPVVGELTLIWSSSSVQLSGCVKTLLKLHCDRCLRPYFQSLTVDLEERFIPADLAEADREPHRELQKNDFVELLPADGLLDISDVVYQAVTLATPSYCLCGDECPGPPLPSEAGKTGVAGGSKAESKQNQPIDPRWKNLKTLFPNEDSQENS